MFNRKGILLFCCSFVMAFIIIGMFNDVTLQAEAKGPTTIELKDVKIPIDGIVGFDVDPQMLDDAINMSEPDLDGVRKVKLLIPEVNNADSFETNLPIRHLTTTEFTYRIDMDTSFLGISIPSNIIVQNELIDSEKITVVASKVNKSKLKPDSLDMIDERPVISIEMEENSSGIPYTNLSLPIGMSIPYAPSKEELNNSESLVVVYIKSDGSTFVVPTSRYNAVTGEMNFNTIGFGVYAVSYIKKTFKDIKNDYWAKNQIELLASRGIINGDSDRIFRPEDNITRADFMVLLVKTLGIDTDFDSNFIDVSSSNYYYKALGITKKLGITQGVGNNIFKPLSFISRQDMITQTAKALKMIDKTNLLETRIEINEFKDCDSIAEYAKESVSTLINKKIIRGNGEFINPLSNATRAETAVIMHRLLSRVQIIGMDKIENDSHENMDLNNTILINKTHKLSAEFVPQNLVTPNVRLLSSINNQMVKEAAVALERLFDEAKRDGIILLAASGYRDYKYQERLYNAKVKRCGKQEAGKYVAPPGSSEHQLGLAMDVLYNKYTIMDEGFSHTEAYKWIFENCFKYGFIIRYPKGKEDITTYNFEPWHLRFVGVEVAKKIYDKGITLEEY